MASVPRSERKYDIVVLGATGFCGKLGALYLADKYASSGLKWAIAGRSQDKLEKVRKECKDLPEIVICDTTNEESINAAVAQTKVMLTTAGPYSRYGTPVVKACAELGTDYCDITGETEWVREMIALYDDKARSTGARIVHFTGHDCVPWDMMTLMLAKKLKEKGEDLQRVDMFDDLSGGVAGGTIETAFSSGGAKPKKILDYDPMMKAGEGASSSKTKIANVTSVAKGEDGRPYRSIFFMAPINAMCVKRSNALLKYSDELTYCEGWDKGGCCGAYSFLFGMAAFGCAMAFPPTRCCIRNYCLPKPGEGPSQQQLTAGFLTVTGVGRGVKGSEVEATMKFMNEDPGTQATMRMCVESALVFLLEKDFECAGGVLTPAACQGETLMNRLIATGTIFSFNEKKASE